MPQAVDIRQEIVKVCAPGADPYHMLRIRTVMVAATLTTVSLGSLTLPALAADSPSTMPAPSAAKASSLSYVVTNGDYLQGIAMKLGVKVADLMSVNKITITTVIHPGQSLIVPEGGTLVAANTAPASTVAAPLQYVVISGDGLAPVARKLGVKVADLLTVNKLTLLSVIHPGMVLTVPAGGKLPTTATAPAAPAATTPAATTPAATTPTATTPAAATPAAATTSYTIVWGDYLVGIAAKNGVTLKALLATNNLITTSAIFPGRTLKVPPATLTIPAAAPVPAAAPAPVTAGAVSAAVTTTSTASKQSITTLIAFLQAQVGKPYVFNTAGPDTYDCSGLVTAAYLQIGISLPHQSQLQSTKGTTVDWRAEDVQPGDLVFQFSSANPTVIGHVGIAIDSTHWIQASGSAFPVKIGPMPSDDKIRAVRRIVQP
jgi:LysM repeat protein